MTSSQAPAAVVAANVRRLRDARRLTLGQLAARCGVSKATLSKLELADANPTLETLSAIADALSSTIADLVVSPDAPPMHVVRREQGLSVTDSAMAGRLVNVLREGAVVSELHDLTCPARQHETSATHGDGAWEQLYVLAGTLVAGPIGHEASLQAGDYAAFAADRPHGYRALDDDARFLLFLTVPRGVGDGGTAPGD